MTIAPDPAIGDVEWSDNWTVGPGIRFELMDVAANSVWLCQTPVDPAAVQALDLPEGWVRAPLGEAGADLAFFRRSPGATADGPLDTREVAGHRMVRVAVPTPVAELAPGVHEVSVDKHHTVRFVARRTITVLDAGDGTVQVPAWASDRDMATPLPDGWSKRTVTLARDLTVALANPARLVIVDGCGFHGPVPGPVLEEVLS